MGSESNEKDGDEEGRESKSKIEYEIPFSSRFDTCNLSSVSVFNVLYQMRNNRFLYHFTMLSY